MPCVYFNDISCNFSKHHETKRFLRHICSSCFTQDGKVSDPSALENRVTLSMVSGVSLQPGRARDIVDKKVFQGRFVYNTVMNVSDVQRAFWAPHLI